MNLAEWRAKQAQDEEALLPSGLEVRVKRVSVFDLVEQGRIPQTLQPQIDAFLKQGTKASAIEMVNGMGELITLCCRAAITAPADLDAAELPFTDRLALFTWLNEDASKVSSFRVGKAKPVAA
jgi:hypothetical protein